MKYLASRLTPFLLTFPRKTTTPLIPCSLFDFPLAICRVRRKSFIYRFYAKSSSNSFIYRFYAKQPGWRGYGSKKGVLCAKIAAIAKLP